jgi:hypothetical protein
MCHERATLANPLAHGFPSSGFPFLFYYFQSTDHYFLTLSWEIAAMLSRVVQWWVRRIVARGARYIKSIHLGCYLRKKSKKKLTQNLVEVGK